MRTPEPAYFGTLQDDVANARGAVAQLASHLSGLVSYPGFFTPAADQIASIKGQLLQALGALDKLPEAKEVQQ